MLADRASLHHEPAASVVVVLQMAVPLAAGRCVALQVVAAGADGEAGQVIGRRQRISSPEGIVALGRLACARSKSSFEMIGGKPCSSSPTTQWVSSFQLTLLPVGSGSGVTAPPSMRWYLLKLRTFQTFAP